MAKIAKYGFGQAPISSRMRRRYDSAVRQTLDAIHGADVDRVCVLDALSEVKGMFNRCVRKDQWDYATVREDLGTPNERTAARIVQRLVDFRTAIRDNDSTGIADARLRLVRSGIMRFLLLYQGNALASEGADPGWLYVLSTKDQPDVLKIGITRRSVSIRVKEINAATGVLFPYAARHARRVSDVRRAERAVHSALAAYRMRNDREFFRLEYNAAIRVIEACMHTAGVVVYDDALPFV